MPGFILDIQDIYQDIQEIHCPEFHQFYETGNKQVNNAGTFRLVKIKQSDIVENGLGLEGSGKVSSERTIKLKCE